MGPKTLNEYLGHASAFVTWMVRQGRLPLNPLLSAGKVESAGSERTRPTYSDEEMIRLITVSGSRGLAYLLAVTTGLRRGELDALLWDDLHLDTAEPFLVARAATTKNRKLARLPLHPEVAEALRKEEHRINAAPERLVFPEGVPSMEVFRQDLKAAGIAIVDTQGRRADFHSLRHTLATRLSRANVPPRIAMELMRHSDMRLTMKTYTDAGSLPMASELCKLPRLSHPLPRPLNPEKTSPDVSEPVQSVTVIAQTQVAERQEERAKLTGLVQACPELAACGAEGLRTPPFLRGQINPPATSARPHLLGAWKHTVFAYQSVLP